MSTSDDDGTGTAVEEEDDDDDAFIVSDDASASESLDVDDGERTEVDEEAVDSESMVDDTTADDDEDDDLAIVPQTARTISTRFTPVAHDDASEDYEAALRIYAGRGAGRRLAPSDADLRDFLAGRSMDYLNAVHTLRSLVSEFGNGNSHGVAAEARVRFCRLRRLTAAEAPPRGTRHGGVCVLCGAPHQCVYEVWDAHLDGRLGYAGSVCGERFRALGELTWLREDLVKAAALSLDTVDEDAVERWQRRVRILADRCVLLQDVPSALTMARNHAANAMTRGASPSKVALIQ